MILPVHDAHKVSIGNIEFEVFKVLEGMVGACDCHSPGPMWCELESSEGETLAETLAEDFVPPVSQILGSSGYQSELVL